MSRRKAKACAGGVHNWGDMGVALDTLVMAYTRGLERQKITFLCDTCGETIALVREAERDTCGWPKNRCLMFQTQREMWDQERQSLPQNNEVGRNGEGR